MTLGERGNPQADQARSTYEITFEEGIYRFNAAAGASHVDNKYLARVTITKDGIIVAKDIRGSTLPDAWTFYVRWNVELKKTTAPKDTDIVQMFDAFERRTAELSKGAGGTRASGLANLAEIVDFVNRAPVIPSGVYSFVTGLHRNGQSVHGSPYAARLLGSAASAPYDPAFPARRATTVGGFIRTLNRNNAQQQKKIANGINIHDGRNSREYKDSEGCLTIRPSDWTIFHRALPSPEQWARAGHVGRVVLSR